MTEGEQLIQNQKSQTAQIVGWRGVHFPLKGVSRLATILQKFLSREMSDLPLMVWYSVGVALVTAPFALWVWSAPSPGELMLMIMTGLFATTAQFFFIRAFRRADASFLAPMFYFHIVPATLIGLFVFAEIPSINTMAGAAVILASLVIMTLLERRRQ